MELVASNAVETSRFYDDNLVSTFRQIDIDFVIMDPTSILGYDREHAEFLKCNGKLAHEASMELLGR
jgi:hypothetical protein